MAGLQKGELREVEPLDVFEGLDRLLDSWTRLAPFRRPMRYGQAVSTEGAIRVEEIREDGALVVRAELSGVDRDKDVELTVSDGRLQIQVERREEEMKEGKGYVRHELRYGSFARSPPLPEGVKETEIVANYKDGILEIRIPAPKREPARRVPIAKP